MTPIEAHVNAYVKVGIGYPLDKITLMSSLTDENAVKTIEQAVARATEAGGKVLTGGKRIDRQGLFVEPTIIEAENHWDIVQEETFAPILYVMKFSCLEDAVAMQNDVPQGLSS